MSHPWRVSREEAAAIQRRLASQVVLRPLVAEGPGSPRFAAGADVAYASDGAKAWAAAVVMDRRYRVVATSVVCGEPDAPYAPGYLAFREGRLTLEALTALPVRPDLVFLDGHGVVHVVSGWRRTSVSCSAYLPSECQRLPSIPSIMNREQNGATTTC